jgi:hypothetical protein
VGQLQILTGEQLNSIERQWTGSLGLQAPFNIRTTKFYTIHRITFYMSCSWEQVRELCVIAVAEDAFDELVIASGLKTGHGKAKRPARPDPPANNASASNFLNRINNLRRLCAQSTLMATTSRLALRIKVFVEPTASNEPWLVKGDAQIWELVNSVYKFHKKGDLEPDEPFLRISKRVVVQEEF